MVGVRLHAAQEFMDIHQQRSGPASAPHVGPVLPKLNTRGTDDICSRHDRGHDAGCRRDHGCGNCRVGHGRAGHGHAGRDDSGSGLYSVWFHAGCGGATRTHFPDAASWCRYMSRVVP